MASNGNGKATDPVLVVIQLSGGLDFLNTLIPDTSAPDYPPRPTEATPAARQPPYD